jgi:periplasmic copper chaperone A
MIRTLAAAIALAAILAVCAQAEASDLAVTHAWARATPPGAMAGAAYVTVTNKGHEADRIVGVSTPVAGLARLHTTIKENGIMKMRPVKAVALKPGGSVTLKPGGMHLMLMQLKHPLKEGESFPLTLTFAKSAPIEVTVRIEKIGAMGEMGGMNMNDMPGMKMK